MKRHSHPAAKPYAVWKEQFIEDRCCTQEEIRREFLYASIPHILLNILLILYWYIGALIFHKIEPRIHYKSIHEAALFCFITTSTIGWGNIVPATYYGKCFIMLYILIGTPLTYVVLGNNGQFLVDLYWILRRSYSKKEGEIFGGEMPLHISYGLLLFHIFLGALLYSLWADNKDFFESFYLTFISITTIGYGDEIPATDRRWEFYVTMAYLAMGVIIVTMVISSMQGVFQSMHNIGRNGIVFGAEAAEIWFGGQAMKVADLVQIVAEHFSVEPEKLRAVLRDLDAILQAATDTESNDGDASPRTTLREFSCDSQQLTLTSLNRSVPPLVLLSRRRSEASALNAQLTVHSVGSHQLQAAKIGSIKAKEFERRETAESASCSF
ncbi:unnamed protein product, partial [Mesorhabditis belari]|uniref:Potassium channel domain-containing protein n=1 Tax=Mesorhabditis belari TaxID=2138241 RepID=A0AAF3F217_9BILA